MLIWNILLRMPTPYHFNVKCFQELKEFSVVIMTGPYNFIWHRSTRSACFTRFRAPARKSSKPDHVSSAATAGVLRWDTRQIKLKLKVDFTWVLQGLHRIVVRNVPPLSDYARSNGYCVSCYYFQHNHQ